MLKNVKIQTFQNWILIKIDLQKKFIIENKLKLTNLLNKNEKNILIEKIKNNLKNPQIAYELKKTTKIELFQLNQNKISVFFSCTKNTNTNTKQKNDKNTTLIAKFTYVQNLINFCTNIKKTFDDLYSASELFQFNGKFFILTTKTKNNLENYLKTLMTEFNALTEKGKFQEALVKEHCQQIFANNAIEKISMLEC